MSDSLQCHELQHARPPCPSLSPGVFSDSCPSSWFMLSNHFILCSLFCFCLQPFPATQGHWETASSVGLEQSSCFTKVPSLLASPCIPKSPQTPGLEQTLCRHPEWGDGEVMPNRRGPSLPCTCWVRASLDPEQLGSSPTAEQSSSPKCRASNKCSTKCPRLLAAVGSLPSFIH